MGSNENRISLSSYKIVALGILIRKAKETIGVFKISDILKQPEQAYKLLTHSVLFGDEELLSLTLELNKTLRISPNLINAIVTYINEMKAQGKGVDFIKRSKKALSKFTSHLFAIELSNNGYRQASDTFLSAADKPEYSFCLNLVRSFHPYWEDANSLFLERNDKKQAYNAKNKQAIMKLWNNLSDAFLTTFEESILSIYVKAIKAISITNEQITLRTKIAKLIIIKQRAHQNTPSGYRDNIAAIESGLSNDDLLAYFLSVSREFHHIWLSAQLSSNP